MYIISHDFATLNFVMLYSEKSTTVGMRIHLRGCFTVERSMSCTPKYKIKKKQKKGNLYKAIFVQQKLYIG